MGPSDWVVVGVSVVGVALARWREVGRSLACRWLASVVGVGDVGNGMVGDGVGDVCDGFVGDGVGDVGDGVAGEGRWW